MKKILYFIAIIVLIGCSNQNQNQNQQDNENEYSLLKLKIDSIQSALDSVDSIRNFILENPNSQKALELLRERTNYIQYAYGIE